MKIDFKKSLDQYSAKANEFRILEIPKTQYLMVDVVNQIIAEFLKTPK
jgi:hypothetical protein